jgi:hypothetical protein
MPRQIMYKCKTPGCDAWLRRGDVPDNTQRSISVVLRIGPPVKITCPDCRREHEYSPSEKKTVELTA